MLEAVLFDWGDTLMQWTWDPALLEVGHAAGLRAIGREPLPELTDRFRDVYLPLMFAPEAETWEKEAWSRSRRPAVSDGGAPPPSDGGAPPPSDGGAPPPSDGGAPPPSDGGAPPPGVVEEVDYPGLVRQLLTESGVEAAGDELDRFLEAEHAEWGPALQLASTTHALLEALRDRGLKVGLVSNAFDPPALLHRDLDRHGVAERLDFAVFSSEVGRRKPDPAIFACALDALGVAPASTLFVGDTIATDIAGAAALGLHTCQAVWFRADDDRRGPEPDFQAFSQMDVMTVVSRLL